MAVKGICPTCSASYSVPEEWVGRTGKCKKCGTAILIKPAGHAGISTAAGSRGTGESQPSGAIPLEDIRKLDDASTSRPSGPATDAFDIGQTMRPSGGPEIQRDEFDSGHTMFAGQPPENQKSEPAAQPLPSVAAPAGNGAAAGELPVGFLLDRRYMILQRLGRGGMGTVYKAIDTETQAEYAIKTLSPDLLGNTEALAGLKKEVATAQQLTHQNLLRVNYLGTSDSLVYLVMEFIDGEDLEAYRLRRGGRLSIDELRKLAPQLLAGLDYLHDRGIVHLDIKPQNVMVTKSGEVKLADFGIAKSIREQLAAREQSQTPVGTLCYMAPEQIRGEVCDRRTDIYALGVMFYQLLAGDFPFSTETREDVVAWHLGPECDLTAVPSGVSELFRRCLARNKGDRYSTCKEIITALARRSDSASPRPPLPDPSEDATYHQYVARKKTILDTDPSDLKAPVPVHPDALVAECRRLLSSEHFTNVVFGLVPPHVKAVHSRFNVCVLSLEKWAFFYPQYRGDFVNIWNQSASVLKKPQINVGYFEQSSLKQKYPPPVATDFRPFVRPKATGSLSSATPSSVAVPSTDVVEAGKAALVAGLEQVRSLLTPNPQSANPSTPQNAAGPPALPTSQNAPQETVVQTAIKATRGCYVATLGCFGVIFVLGFVMTIPVMLQLPGLVSRNGSISDPDATESTVAPSKKASIADKAAAKPATTGAADKSRTTAAVSAEEMKEMSFQQMLERFGEPEEVYRKPGKQNQGLYIWKTGEDDYAVITFVEAIDSSGQMLIVNRFVHRSGSTVAKLKKALDQL